MCSPAPVEGLNQPTFCLSVQRLRNLIKAVLGGNRVNSSWSQYKYNQGFETYTKGKAQNASIPSNTVCVMEEIQVMPGKQLLAAFLQLDIYYF